MEKTKFKADEMDNVECYYGFNPKRKTEQFYLVSIKLYEQYYMFPIKKNTKKLPLSPAIPMVTSLLQYQF